MAASGNRWRATRTHALDCWFATHSRRSRALQKLRSGRSVDSDFDLLASRRWCVPPVGKRPRPAGQPDSKDAQFLRGLILYEDDELFVFNKPAGLAAQGGSGQKRHMDGLLKSLPNKKGETPKLVHRLDRDTSGCLVVAKTKAAATHFGEVFRSRSARKIYWAIVAGNPQPRQGRISCFLAKQKVAGSDDEQMVGAHDERPFDHRDRQPPLRLVTLKPVTGRNSVHMALGTSITAIRASSTSTGRRRLLKRRTHARRIQLPLAGKPRCLAAPPPHMQQSRRARLRPDRFDVQQVN